MCCKCSKLWGIVLLVIGIGYLLADWYVWSFWSIQPWTFVFLLAGAAVLCKSCCGQCQTEACACEAPKKAKKK